MVFHELPKHVEHEWVAKYLNSLTDGITIEEMVDFLVTLKTSLENQGYEVPKLTEMCLRLKDYLSNQDIELDDLEFNNLFNAILMRENSNPYVHAVLDSNNFDTFNFNYIKKNKSKNSSKLSSKMTFGLIKCLGGGLLCIIPLPATQAIGAGLILNGINDCVDDARDQGDANDRMQKLDQMNKQEEK